MHGFIFNHKYNLNFLYFTTYGFLYIWILRFLCIFILTMDSLIQKLKFMTLFHDVLKKISLYKL